jgi:fatty acid desaturase
LTEKVYLYRAMKQSYISDTVSINSASLKELSTLNPWKSVLAISLEWLVIASCILLHRMFSHPVIYLFVWVIISTRLYALYSLLHDAIHYSITRNKKLNDFLGQVFLGLPLFISLKEMRKIHLNHHKYLQTENDPEIKHLLYSEFQFPKSRRELVKIFSADLVGINFLYYRILTLSYFVRHLNKLKMRNVLQGFLFMGIIALLVYLDIWREVLLYWIIPYATIYQLLNRVRLTTEHFHIEEGNAYKTRSVIVPFVQKIFLTPYNLGYHLEHHLYPAVPFYNLPALHKLLCAEPAYISNAIIRTGYYDLLNDFTKKDGK